MDFRTMVDDVDLRGQYVRGEKLRMMHGDDDREINSLAELGRAVRRAAERNTTEKKVLVTEGCAIAGCNEKATVIATLPAFPLNWEHWVCARHLKVLNDPHTKLNYLDDDTVGILGDECSTNVSSDWLSVFP